MNISKLLLAKSIFVSLSKEKLPAKIGYKIVRFIKSAEIAEEFFNSKMREIIEECCERDEKGNFVVIEGEKGYKIKPEKKEECREMTNELNAVEVEPPEIRFTLDELSELKMSVADIYNIDEFITE